MKLTAEQRDQLERLVDDCLVRGKVTSELFNYVEGLIPEPQVMEWKIKFYQSGIESWSGVTTFEATAQHVCANLNGTLYRRTRTITDWEEVKS